MWKAPEKLKDFYVAASPNQLSRYGPQPNELPITGMNNIVTCAINVRQLSKNLNRLVMPLMVTHS